MPNRTVRKLSQVAQISPPGKIAMWIIRGTPFLGRLTPHRGRLRQVPLLHYQGNSYSFSMNHRGSCPRAR